MPSPFCASFKFQLFTGEPHLAHLRSFTAQSSADRGFIAQTAVPGGQEASSSDQLQAVFRVYSSDQEPLCLGSFSLLGQRNSQETPFHFTLMHFYMVYLGSEGDPGCNQFICKCSAHKTPYVHRLIKVNHGGLTGLQEQQIVPRSKGLLNSQGNESKCLPAVTHNFGLGI